MYIVGIDIAKRKHEAAVIDGEGAVIIKPFSFTNNCSGYNRLLAMLAKAKLPLDEVSFAMEATGHYWLALFTRLQKEGFRVQVINPVQTNSIRSFYIRQAKTDPRDALLIAEVIRFGHFSESTLHHENIYELDTDPHSGKGFLADLQAKIDELGVGKIASVSGRYYAMDRDNNWDREEKAYAAFVYGEGEHFANAQEAIEASYANDKTDEFVLPCVTCEGGRVQDGDTVIFMNFRPDRARQMTRIFCDDAFTGFERRGGRKQVNYVCMAEYDATMPNCEVAYPPVELKNVLGQYLSENGKTQLRIAETEKYAHVTFFFNGGVEAPYEGEDRCVIPSPKVATYDLKPEMSAPEVAAECKKRIESGKYDVIILNFANCDMVGHTGVFDAAVKAVEAVDAAVEEVVTAVLNAGGCAFLTADHGNAEKMKNPDGTPFTAHTTNVVPFVAIGCGDVKLREGGCLADIAPTMLPYIGLPAPAEMTGKSIIVE